MDFQSLSSLLKNKINWHVSAIFFELAAITIAKSLSLMLLIYLCESMGKRERKKKSEKKRRIGDVGEKYRGD